MNEILINPVLLKKNVNPSANKFVTRPHIDHLANEMMHHRDEFNSKGSSNGTDFDGKTVDEKSGYTIPQSLFLSAKIGREVKSRLRNTTLTDEEVDQISDEISESISDTLDEHLSDIEDALRDNDRSRIKEISRIILTAIVGKFIDDIFNIMMNHGDEIVNAIVEIIGSHIP